MIMENFLFVLPLEVGTFTAAALTILSNVLLLFLNINLFGFDGAGNSFYCIIMILLSLMMLSGIKTVKAPLEFIFISLKKFFHSLFTEKQLKNFAMDISLCRG